LTSFFLESLPLAMSIASLKEFTSVACKLVTLLKHQTSHRSCSMGPSGARTQKPTCFTMCNSTPSSVRTIILKTPVPNGGKQGPRRCEHNGFWPFPDE
jgi:hypothetical protein